MKLGIAGAGMIVADLLSVLQDIPGIAPKAICSTPNGREKMLHLQERYDISRTYTDYGEMLRDDEVDTVYIGVPNHLHYSFAREALLHGRHVICEKPFTSCMQEFLELKALAHEHNLVLVEAITNQYLNNALLIKEYLPRVGEIKIVECNYSQYSSRYDAFKAGKILPAFNPEMSGGALMDINIYNIHLVVGLFGSPKKTEYLANIDRGIDTSGILLLDYGDFKGVCIGSKDSSAPAAVNIQGDQGCIHMASSPNLCDSFEYIPVKGPGVRVDRKSHPHRMYDEFVEFDRIIRELDVDKASSMLEHSRKVMRVVEEAKASAGNIFGSSMRP